MDRPYRNRTEAGHTLAMRLRDYADERRAVILALPRGGLPVAREIADELGLPMDVFLVRKLGVPGHEELAMGALAEGGVRVLNEEIVTRLGISDDVIEEAAERAEAELKRRAREYRADREPLPIEARNAILVDDGLATGATMRSAIRAVRQRSPTSVVVATPVAPAQAVQMLEAEADGIICGMVPAQFSAVGQWYEDFRQVDDDEVRHILQEHWAQLPENAWQP